MDEPDYKCQHKGCCQPAIKCTIPAGTDLITDKPYDESYEYYCWIHAIENGYCPCCGGFIAGTCDEDRYGGLCEICNDQISFDVDDNEYFEEEY